MINPSIDKTEWEKFKGRFRAFQQTRPQRIAAALSSAAELPLSKAKTYYLTGAALKVDTGRLRSSVTKSPSFGAVRSGESYAVVIGTNVWYGGAWEKGFTVSAKTIYPVRAKALRFVVNGQEVFAKKVFRPARNQAPRKWLEPSVTDTKQAMIKILAQAGVILQ